MNKTTLLIIFAAILILKIQALFCESVILIVSHPLKKKMGTRENETWRRINNGTQGDTTQS